jgi:hypothetical protein
MHIFGLRSGYLRVLAADYRLVKGQLFPVRLPQRENAIAANAVLLTAMDHARLSGGET